MIIYGIMEFEDHTASSGLRRYTRIIIFQNEIGKHDVLISAIVLVAEQ